MGYAGVPKPGDEENVCSFAAEVVPGLKAGGGSRGVDTGSSILIECQLLLHSGCDQIRVGNNLVYESRGRQVARATLTATREARLRVRV